MCEPEQTLHISESSDDEGSTGEEVSVATLPEAQRVFKVDVNGVVITRCMQLQGRIQECLKEGVHLVAVIYNITNFYFLMKLYKIIKPRPLEKRGLQPP